MYALMRSVAGALALAPPIVLVLTGCRFNLPDLPGGFPRGPLPHSDAIFCNIEAGRRCSTPTERQVGVDIRKPYEEGFWAGKSSLWGLDYAQESLDRCGGEPETVVFRGEFPEGNAICLNGTQFDSGWTVKGACESWCDSHEWIDGDGNKYDCKNIAWPSAGSWKTPVVNACLPSGTLRPEFQDLRRQRPNPIAWTSTSNVMVSGNSIRRTNGGTLPNSGAASAARLQPGRDGFVDFVAIETNRLRLCGLAIGQNDTNQQPADIDFAIDLGSDGTFTIRESNVPQTGPRPYQALDRFRVAVIGGVVQYFRNEELIFTSGKAIGYPMRVDTSLLEQNATISDVRASFQP